jgi:hypothetical protein
MALFLTQSLFVAFRIDDLVYLTRPSHHDGTALVLDGAQSAEGGECEANVSSPTPTVPKLQPASKKTRNNFAHGAHRPHGMGKGTQRKKPQTGKSPPPENGRNPFVISLRIFHRVHGVHRGLNLGSPSPSTGRM